MCFCPACLRGTQRELPSDVSLQLINVLFLLLLLLRAEWGAHTHALAPVRFLGCRWAPNTPAGQSVDSGRVQGAVYELGLLSVEYILIVTIATLFHDTTARECVNKGGEGRTFRGRFGRRVNCGHPTEPWWAKLRVSLWKPEMGSTKGVCSPCLYYRASKMSFPESVTRPESACIRFLCQNKAEGARIERAENHQSGVDSRVTKKSDPVGRGWNEIKGLNRDNPEIKRWHLIFSLKFTIIC